MATVPGPTTMKQPADEVGQGYELDDGHIDGSKVHVAHKVLTRLSKAAAEQRNCFITRCGAELGQRGLVTAGAAGLYV